MYKNNNKGFTTILALLLISLSLIGVFVVSANSLKNSQSASASTHQTLQVQTHAWTGAEAIRAALLDIGADKVAHLEAGTSIAVEGIDGLKAKVISNDTSKKLITIDIYSCSSSTNISCLNSSKAEILYSGATTTLEVIYQYSDAATTAATATSNYIINVSGDLTLNGGITFKGSTQTASVVVDGNLSSGSGFSGIDKIYSTKDIYISGGGAGGNSTMSAEGNITLSGSGTYGTVNSMKNVTMSGGTTATTIQSNETVTLSNSSVSNVSSIGNVYVTGGGTQITTINTMGSVVATGGSITNTNANGAVTVVNGNNSTINAIGNVTVVQGSFLTINTNGTYKGTNGPSLKTLNAIGGINQTNGSIASSKTQGNQWQSGTSTTYGLVQGNLTEDQWGSFDGLAGGTITKSQQWNMNVKGTVQPGLQVTITPVTALSIPPLTKTTLDKSYVDAYSLINSANYVFTYSSGKMLVKINNVNGVANGTYFLNQSYPYMDYACIVASPKVAGDCVAKVGSGWSAYNSLFSYDTNAKKWFLAGKSLAPGIVFFEGSLDIGTGTYNNTFISTGSITTNGAAVVNAVNYAGYVNVCANPDYPNQFPAQLCDKSKVAYVSTALGNTALLAGSYTNGVFSGGNITLGASVKVYGNVVAGNVLETGGATILYGYITVANQGNSTTGSKFGGSTIIDLTNLPSTYDPSSTVVGGMATGSISNSAAATVILKAARYQ